VGTGGDMKEKGSRRPLKKKRGMGWDETARGVYQKKLRTIGEKSREGGAGSHDCAAGDRNKERERGLFWRRGVGGGPGKE